MKHAFALTVVAFNKITSRRSYGDQHLGSYDHWRHEEDTDDEFVVRVVTHEQEWVRRASDMQDKCGTLTAVRN